jgi:hypothetical protein
MPLTDPPPAFNPPWDLHILRGQGPVRLGGLLWVHWEQTPDDIGFSTFDDYAARFSDVEMRFRPTFNYSIAGDSFVGFGIELNRLTGVLTANAWPPASFAPSNFIVEVTVADNGAGPLNALHFPVALLRVHVHRQVSLMWLTPRLLSVRRDNPGDLENTGSTFAVRALFDDGVVGDITTSDQLTMLPADHFRRTRSGLRQIHLPATVPDNTMVAISATTSPAWGGLSYDGNVRVLTPWTSEQNIPRAEWIDGDRRVLDGTRPVEDLANVLFVNCGFLTDRSAADESHSFVAITDLVVQKIRTEKLFQPFGYLSQSINFWRLTIPDQSSGISVRCEVYAVMRDGQLFARPMPACDLPIGAGEWTLENLIYMAGLPVRADLALVRYQGQPLASVNDLQGIDPNVLDTSRLVQKWSAIMQPTPARNVLKKVVAQWLALAERTFIDDVDAFPGTVIGKLPSASPEFNEFLEFDPFRGGAVDLSFYLLDHVTAAPRGNAPPVKIQNPPDRIFGDLWRSDLYAFRNQSSLVALSNVPYGRAQHQNVGVQARLYLAGPGGKGEMPGLPVNRIDSRNSLALAPMPPTPVVLPNTWRTIVHELGHSFGLGDEYVEFAERYTGTEAGLDDYGNLTTPGTFINPDGTLNLPQIKWNWHRIRFASVIQQIARVGTSSRFELHIRPRPVPWFLTGDIVLLRSRQRFVVINRTTPVSAPYIIEQVSAAGDVLTVAPTQPNTDLAGFVAGSIVYKPVPGETGSQFRRLISPAAERIMQIAIKGTMTGSTCVISDQMAHKDAAALAPLKDDPLGHVSSKNLPGLVGAHFGGRRYACGVVHPSGHCMMRNKPEESASFCPVCQYVLVDQIDPEQHWLVDHDYEPKYPR